MARGRRAKQVKTTEEKLLEITETLQQYEDKIAELKAEKAALEEAKRQEDINALVQAITANNMTIEDATQMILSKRVSDAPDTLTESN